MPEKIIVGFLLIIAFKFISNYMKYLRCKKLSALHALWLSSSEQEFLLHVGETRTLFKNADVSDICVPVSQPVGGRIIRNINAPVLTNLDSKIIDIASSVTKMFDQAIGTYRKRAFESFNPLYWIETIVFLPKNLLKYIGFDLDSTASKLCNVLLTFIWWTISGLAVFFLPQLKELVITALS